MKPVYQTIFESGSGDCLSACLASLLELDLADVPKFRRDNPVPGEMMRCVRAWLAAKFNLSLVTIQMENDEEHFSGSDLRLIGTFAGTPCIAGGASPNVPGGQHAVCGEIDRHGMNFAMIFDPHPSGKGIIGKPKHLYFFVPLSPAEVARAPFKRVFRMTGGGLK